MSDSDQPDIITLSKQGGAEVFVVDEEVVFKKGCRVEYQEEAALKIVGDFTNTPVPHVFFSSYSDSWGSIAMSLMSGVRLDRLWDKFGDATKELACYQIWKLVAQLQKIPKPDHLHSLFQCSADGSPTKDVLIKDLHEPPWPILDDECLRRRICERYEHYGGRKYAGTLFEMLKPSEASVFTHGDVAPRNILVDEDGNITGVLDWENAGWYPDYWKYCNIMRPSGDRDWQE